MRVLVSSPTSTMSIGMDSGISIGFCIIGRPITAIAMTATWTTTEKMMPLRMI